jgi:hypothetical protein
MAGSIGAAGKWPLWFRRGVARVCGCCATAEQKRGSGAPRGRGCTCCQYQGQQAPERARCEEGKWSVRCELALVWRCAQHLAQGQVNIQDERGLQGAPSVLGDIWGLQRLDTAW